MTRFSEQLERQLAFLARSCAIFDAGYRDEAIRMAVPLRVLLYDTKKSTSLLTHLGAKPIKLLSTVKPLPPGRKVFVLDGVTRWSGAGPVACLGAGSYAEELDFDEWWNQTIYISTDLRTRRCDLVLGAANKDGGAHVDKSLRPEYEAVLKMWVRHPMGGSEPPTPVEDIHFIGLRQISYEVLHSPEILRLRYRPDGAVDSTFLRSQADRFLHEEDSESAILFLRKAVEAAPEDPGTHRKLGIVYGQNGLLEQAMEELEMAVRLAPGDHVARRNFGKVLRELGQLEEAEAQFLEALTIEPEDVRSIWGLSILYLEENEPERAWERCRQALELSPDADVLKDLGGICLLRLGKADDALAYFDQSCRAGPGNPQFKINRAGALTALGRIEEAIEEVASAVRLDPAKQTVAWLDEDLAPLRSQSRFRVVVGHAED